MRHAPPGARLWRAARPGGSVLSGCSARAERPSAHAVEAPEPKPAQPTSPVKTRRGWHAVAARRHLGRPRQQAVDTLLLQNRSAATGAVARRAPIRRVLRPSALRGRGLGAQQGPSFLPVQPTAGCAAAGRV